MMQIIKKIDEKQLRILVIGKFLIILAIGSMFSIKLVQYGYFILLGATLLSIYAVLENLTKWKKQSKTKTNIYLYITSGLIVFFFGIQSPQIPAKLAILIIGIILIFPAIKGALK